MNNTQSDSIAALAAALSKCQGMLSHAVKDATNPHLKSRYADLASCINAAKEPLSQNGLAVIQATAIQDGKTVLVTTLCHSSGEWVKSVYPVNPVKVDPQGMGSAITYARRYSLSAIIGLAADDDDGQAASSPTKLEPSKPEDKTTIESRLQPYDEAEFNAKSQVWMQKILEGVSLDAIIKGAKSQGRLLTPAQINIIREATV